MAFKNSLYTQGFTLIEVIITLMIASILASIAAPSFSTLIKSNRITSSVNELTAALYLSRSEAIKRGRIVRVCASSNGASCATSGNWEQGWIIFEDENNNGVVDTGEELIRVHKAIANQVTIVGNADLTLGVSYTPTGRLTPSTNGSITVCDDRAANDYGRQIKLVRTGRFRIATPETEGSITCP